MDDFDEYCLPDDVLNEVFEAAANGAFLGNSSTVPLPPQPPRVDKGSRFGASRSLPPPRFPS